MKYQAKVAKMFKERENKENEFEICIGKVISPPPALQISIYNGEVILYPEQLYMNDRLFDDHIRDFKIDGKLESIKIDSTTSTGKAGEGPHSHTHSTIEGSGEYRASGKITNTDTLKVGDFVKVTPVENGQIWIVDFKIRKIGVK